MYGKGNCPYHRFKEKNKREAATEDVLKRTCPDLRLKENN
jgi:hypothetical protein